MDGRTSKDPIEKLLAMGRLLGLNDTDSEAPFRFANLAWTNGAYAAAMGVTLSEILRLTGGREKAAAALLERVWQVKGVAGTEEHPVVEQGGLPKTALGENPTRQYRSLQGLTRTAALAGWLAINQQHLVSARAIEAVAGHPVEGFLAAQLWRQSEGSDCLDSKEALARFVGGVSGPSEQVERRVIMAASERSLAAARKHDWSVVQFVRDASKRGEELARRQPERTLRLLEEVGAERLDKLAATFPEKLPCGLAKASDAQGWDALQDWLPVAHREIVGAPTEAAALLLLHHAYDFMFWLGLLRQLKRDKTQVEAAQQTDFELESACPDWAASAIGQQFDCSAAADAGWIDQGSAKAHFGLETGKGIWIYRLAHGNEDRPCGRVWWRFVIVELDLAEKIKHMRTEVHEVFPDGQGELFCTDFLPHDVAITIEALERATQGIPENP